MVHIATVTATTVLLASRLSCLQGTNLPIVSGAIMERSGTMHEPNLERSCRVSRTIPVEGAAMGCCIPEFQAAPSAWPCAMALRAHVLLLLTSAAKERLADPICWAEDDGNVTWPRKGGWAGRWVGDD